MYSLRNVLRFLFMVVIPLWSSAAAGFSTSVEVEETIYSIKSADNGAGPLWDFGSTNLIRVADEVYISGLETLPNEPPLNNTRCNLWTRAEHGWTLIQTDPTGRTREPCPIAVLPELRKVFLSANPTLNPPGRPGPGPAQPTLLAFSIDALAALPDSLSPVWQRAATPPNFTEHSYRSLAADGRRGELILFQNIDYSHAEWAFRGNEGQWAAQGQLIWPWGAASPKPTPIRVCYPNVMIQNRAVHFVGVSDIVEPNEDWRQYKRDATGKKWDYDLRRLFYTWSPDISKQGFLPWLEISSREDTAGHIVPGDLWLGGDGAVHIVWEEAALDLRLRDKFFPEAKQRWELNYAVVRAGKVESLRTLLGRDESKAGPIPHLPRFQVTPEGRLFVFFYVNGTDDAGKPLSENRLLEIYQDGSISPIARVPLAQPLNNYMTATVRAGSAPSNTLDLLGTAPGQPNTIRYARVRID